MPKKGFTLVELLVTISILAILMSIALISYGNIQKNARDAKRKSDLATIQAALEQYHADLGAYPVYLNGLSSGTKIYLSKIPKDNDGSSYSYEPKPRFCDMNICTNYCLYATVENPANNVSALLQCSPATNQYQVQAP